MLKRGFSTNWFTKKKRSAPSRVVLFNQQQKYNQRMRGNLLRKTSVQLTAAKLSRLRTPARWWSKVLVVLGLGLVGYLLFGTNLFVLDTLRITGTHLTEPDAIQAVLFPRGFTKMNALTWWESRAKHKVESLPQVQLVHFVKNFISDTLTVEVTEQQMAVVWQTAGEKFLINRHGVAYDRAEEGNPLLTIEDLKNIPISLNQRIVTSDFIDFVTSFAANLPRKTNLVIRRITVPETTFEVEMETSEGWRIILDTTGSYDEQLNNLVRVLQEMGDRKPREYVDLRVGKKVFYK
ncbi:hypothetical protein A3K24_03480 [candidate division Kazan bacterium RIFCSPHIGHO2_01_FULL_44_14]|uniref:Cell division protein FtsQ/DivIB C-terminal domain-containing protein n=1 Tax=candidate division Kazan bacterium RIFCSPLOWO2_01_FULL_45_19 TaxID=1798538 RepID=A0A1F4NQV8_UNCK3|nr:hypothetical protein [uncultured bacterium]AQS30244.1 hypothetical protein [uncultured bacterium]OGB73853.1 MAG: hypothetical protein A3K51_03480 [candidate division Kazan bacterium RIFCSPLOWO2_01_FULL_45_19]OGB78098.1 MAG: hypothetical protein A3K24_03480 [candidate division Kazan bacterium RIFCSPHIGHO2_01_FULL_44_14]